MPTKLRIYNTLSRAVEDFQPLNPPKVGIYSCGPTVYHYAHIGNMRAYIFADTLVRGLEFCGYQVNQVMNITDVGHLTDDGSDGEDKVEIGSRREGLTAWDVAQRYTDAFFAHSQMLNIRRPHVVCKATDYIAEQIAMVKTLEDKGYTYKTADGVYFDTAKFPDYSKLGKLDIEGLREGIRVDAGDKRNKTDFALWKFSKPEEHRQMEWDAPWGRGFPGWHIECSAMAMRFLGPQFDIHTGGVDHIPIHHTNEIAQTECATGKTPFVKYWMHGEFLVIDDATKMSKSLGHILTVQTLVDKGYDPLAYRMLVLQSHYRKQLHFSFETLSAAARGYERLIGMIQQLKASVKGPSLAAATLSDAGTTRAKAFSDAIAADLNTPQAVAEVYGVLQDAAIPPHEKLQLLVRFDAVLGLRLLAEPVTKSDAPPEMLKLLADRNAARAGKQWAEADRLRKAIADAGWEILDNPAGSALKRRT